MPGPYLFILLTYTLVLVVLYFLNQKCVLIAFDAGYVSPDFMDVYPRLSGFVFFLHQKCLIIVFDAASLHFIYVYPRLSGFTSKGYANGF